MPPTSAAAFECASVIIVMFAIRQCAVCINRKKYRRNTNNSSSGKRRRIKERHPKPIWRTESLPNQNAPTPHASNSDYAPRSNISNKVPTKNPLSAKKWLVCNCYAHVSTRRRSCGVVGLYCCWSYLGKPPCRLAPSVPLPFSTPLRTCYNLSLIHI